MGRKCRFQSIDDQFFRRSVGCGDKIVIAFQFEADALRGEFVQQGAGFRAMVRCGFEELRPSGDFVQILDVVFVQEKVRFAVASQTDEVLVIKLDLPSSSWLSQQSHANARPGINQSPKIFRLFKCLFRSFRFRGCHSWRGQRLRCLCLPIIASAGNHPQFRLRLSISILWKDLWSSGTFFG